MNVTRVRLRNFLSHPDTDWRPGGRLAVLVGPKGAGKSAILDAVAYALFDSARSKTDDLVRRGASDMSVAVDFELDGQHYRVERGRTTHSGGKTYLAFVSVPPEGGGGEPIAESSAIRDVQAAIDDVLRVDAATFASAVLLMQRKVDAFARATAGERKAILASILSLQVYEAARERARGAKTVADGEVNTQTSMAERWKDALAVLPDPTSTIAELEVGQTKVQEVVDGLDRRIADLTLLVDAEAKTGDALPELQAGLARLNREKAQADVQTERRLADIVRGARTATEELRRQRDALFDAFRDQKASIAAKHQALQSEVDTLDRLIAEAKRVTCPECGAEFMPDRAHLQERLDAVRASVAALPPIPDAPDLSSMDEAIAAVRTQADADQVEAREDGDRATAQLAQAIAELEATIRQTTDMMQARRQAEASRASLQRDRASLQQTLAANAQRIAVLRERGDQRAKLQVNLDAANYDREIALEEQRLYGELMRAFGPSGIPARIIEDVLGDLETAAQHVIDDLSPGATLTLQAQRASKTAGEVETLDILYRDTEGQRDVRMLSGGEATSVSLALSVSLARLNARRAGVQIKMLAVDEPDGLDTDTRRAFGQMVRTLAHQGDLERVILVSHHPDLAEYGDAVYAVSRDSRGSAVVQQ